MAHRCNTLHEPGIKKAATVPFPPIPQDARALHTLVLDLRGNGVGDRGAQALASLHSAPALQSLELDLGFNPILKTYLELIPDCQPVAHVFEPCVAAFFGHLWSSSGVVGPLLCPKLQQLLR